MGCDSTLEGLRLPLRLCVETLFGAKRIVTMGGPDVQCLDKYKDVVKGLVIRFIALQAGACWVCRYAQLAQLRTGSVAIRQPLFRDMAGININYRQPMLRLT